MARSKRTLQSKIRTLDGVALAARDVIETVRTEFTKRVGRVVHELGIPTRGELASLSGQVAELQARVDKLQRARARA